MLVGPVDGVPLVDGGETVLVGVWPSTAVLVCVVGGVPLLVVGAMIVWLCVVVRVGIVDRVTLVGCGEVTLVRVCPCVTLLVGTVVGLTLIGSDVVASVEVAGLPVGCTALVLLVVLGPVEMYNVGQPVVQ